jgi:Ca2+-binding EF-hand superfamily protein
MTGRRQGSVAFLVAALGIISLLASAPAARSGTTDDEQRTTDDVQDFVFLSESRPVLVRLHLRIDGKPYLTAWREFIEHLFKQLDTNGDGVLSKEEVERMPPPQVLFGGALNSNFVPPSLAQVDSNRDGVVSLEELAAYYRRNGGMPFQVDFGPEQRSARQVVVSSFGQRQPVSADEFNEALFTLLDTNKDGKLSKEELAAAPAVLLQRDENDDEMVTIQELLPGMQANTGVVANESLSMRGQAANSLFLMVNPSESGLPLARQLQARYGRKGNSKLTRKDLGLDEESFKQLDMDEDGELDLEELARFARRPADLELMVRLGDARLPRSAVELVRDPDRPAPLTSSVRTLQEGGVAVDIGMTRVELRARSNEPIFHRRVNNRESYKAQFRALDRDANGYLEMSEVQQNLFFRALFKVMDRDGDGKLYEKEVLAYLDEIEDLQAWARTGSASLLISDQGRGLFDLLDTDRDGRLSVREMRNAVKLLESLDRDGDGQLSRTEVPRGYQMSISPGTSRSNLFSDQVVVATSRGMIQQPARPRTAGPLWFRKMDRNHDGDVSRREFLGTDKAFAEIDTDGDGLISLEEAERADVRFRQGKEPGR